LCQAPLQELYPFGARDHWNFSAQALSKSRNVIPDVLDRAPADMDQIAAAHWQSRFGSDWGARALASRNGLVSGTIFWYLTII
jgi:hypothetical protein